MKLIPHTNFFDNALDIFDTSIFNNNIMKSDIYEKDGNYIIEIDLPGFKKEEINVDLDDKYLVVKAIKTESIEEKYIKKERYYGEYKRSFYVGDVKENSIKASYNNGMLSLSFPKVEVDKSRKKQIYID